MLLVRLSSFCKPTEEMRHRIVLVAVVIKFDDVPIWNAAEMPRAYDLEGSGHSFDIRREERPRGVCFARAQNHVGQSKLKRDPVEVEVEDVQSEPA